MSLTITSVTARAIPDSRGIPTVETSIELSDGSKATAAVPAGTSTGRYEAVELRDGDPATDNGKGVNRAIGNVTAELLVAVKGKSADLPAIDQAMIQLDGTPNKHRLGANAILSVSLALARAAAVSYRQPLYAYLAAVYGRSLPKKMPRPLVNVFEGGRHADTPLSVQEFHLIPEAETTAQQMADVRATFKHLEAVVSAHQVPVKVGYEGGYTAPLPGHVAVFTALQEAGHRAGVPLSFGIDAAASEFYDDTTKSYHLLPESLTLSSQQLIELYASWARQFPLHLIEDPVNEDDWQGWEQAQAALGSSVSLIGDDFFTTNVQRIQAAFDRKISVGVLLKPNQIGTVTETVAARILAEKSGVPTVMSNRSGETMDSFIADFAVALSTDYLKSGGPNAPERASKYDRLVAIAHELHA